MIIELIILLILTFSFLIIFAYISTHKKILIQKYNSYKKEKESKNYNIIENNNKKGIFNTIKSYFINDYIIYTKPKTKEENTFTILSYNILAQRYVHRLVKVNKFLEKKN